MLSAAEQPIFISVTRVHSVVKLISLFQEAK